ncbi:helix-turn-helix domain-containing protein [Mycetohabitans sp. B8]|uniref:transcriptional regulator n=1 Tax=Mycetohabitans sp. B8 TaxID=2841845 RepID=UPI001F2E452E|nr:YdaS family helix-turn-helix protein [Mycetohabitans sp. B8]MCG1042526.1 helix-turn-helix domain-containing protein [Mycetohabitans sp. B8]
MTTSVIQRAAQLAGGQSALARKLGCTPQSISKMCATGRVPAERVLAIEAAVKGAVTRHELRPDLYPIDPSVQPISDKQARNQNVAQYQGSM